MKPTEIYVNHTMPGDVVIYDDDLYLRIDEVTTSQKVFVSLTTYKRWYILNGEVVTEVDSFERPLPEPIPTFVPTKVDTGRIIKPFVFNDWARNLPKGPKKDPRLAQCSICEQWSSHLTMRDGVCMCIFEEPYY
ncbi:MAG: hypothetical protein JRC86_13230 [Deltaproteobacteria bacterium]|nr:hypothetical protein [Deltaproteobacteria bacterium]